jgi:amino acid adenylation domain-containing protein
MISISNDIKTCLSQNLNDYAFCIEDNFYTYKELNDRVSIILSSLDYDENSRVAIFCENNIDTYAAILACWINGLAYVPLLFKNPIERNLAILKEAKVSTVICTKKVLNNFYSDNYKILHTHLLNPNNLKDIVSKEINPVNEAYVLFTSGSTGTPKGVPISFENLQKFLNSFKKTGFYLEKQDRCLQMFELTFDVSISSFLTALLAGACVYTVSDKTHKYIDVFRIINKYRLTSIQIVPSILKLGQPFLKRIDFSSIQTCILTGEASSIVEVENFQNVAPHTTIFNYYGPTESTIYCSAFKIDNNKVKEYNGMVSIGKPFDNNSFLLLNNEGEIIKDEGKGELWISSQQLTQGYLDENLNEKSFRIINNQRYYKTGDLCFIDKEGDYLYCGRIDNQIQIQGFRVELGEVEFKAREKTGFNCVAVDVTNNNFTEIILFLESSSKIVTEEIMRSLKDVLPNYMLPQRIIKLSTFPLTQSGKTDRVALKSIISEK